MRPLAALLAAVTAALALAAAAHAAEHYPSRPIRLLIPFVPGGSTDFIARTMQAGLQAELGQPLVLDNRPGAAGNIAMEMTARAAPDGHTVLFGNVGAIAINPVMFRKLAVDPARDFACVNIAADVASVMVVHPSLQVQTLKEFIAYAKARPGQINWGSSSPGGSGTLGMQYFANKTGLSLTLVAYKGAGALSTALVSGEVGVAFVAVPPVIGFVKSGQLRPLAVRGGKRLELLLPTVPTLAEQGFPELTNDSWQGLFVPARTPIPVVARLNAAVRKVLADAKTAERIKTGGAAIIDTETPEKCTAFVKAQTAFWGDLARQVGLAGTL